MKYIITENKINESIETYILRTFPEVMKVHFTKKKVLLGSSAAQPIIEQMVIHVTINNLDGKMKLNDLKDLSKYIWTNLNDMFSLGMDMYASEWDFEFHIATIVTIKNLMK